MSLAKLGQDPAEVNVSARMGEVIIGWAGRMKG